MLFGKKEGFANGSSYFLLFYVCMYERENRVSGKKAKKQNQEKKKKTKEQHDDGGDDDDGR